MKKKLYPNIVILFLPAMSPALSSVRPFVLSFVRFAKDFSASSVFMFVKIKEKIIKWNSRRRF